MFFLFLWSVIITSQNAFTPLLKKYKKKIKIFIHAYVYGGDGQYDDKRTIIIEANCGDVSKKLDELWENIDASFNKK